MKAERLQRAGLLLVTLLVVTSVASFKTRTQDHVTADPRLRALEGKDPLREIESAEIPDLVHYEPVWPVVVRMVDLPPDNDFGDSKYERWLRGELGSPEFRIEPAMQAALKAQSLLLRYDARIQQMNQGGAGRLAPIVGVDFDSLDVDDCCASGATVPPDPEMSAGPNHLIAVVNVAFEVYDKSGTSLIGPTTLNSLFSLLGGTNCTAGGPFDPNTLYDEAADRFMIAADGDGQAYCMAVSQTGDPTGSWVLYEFATDVGGHFFDFPHAGIGRDAIYMGGNMFAGLSFAEGRVWAIDKAALYAGEPATIVSRSTGGDGTPQPANLHGFNQGTWPNDGPHFILTDGDFDGSTYTLYSWDDPFGSNTFTIEADLNLGSAHGVNVGMPVDNVQSGGATGGDIMGNDFRVLDFEYRNGSGWTAMTVACNPGSGTVNCVQWAEIDLVSRSTVQAGVFASNGDYRYFPDIAANHCGDAALGYTKSSASTFPAVWLTGRESGDAQGTMQAETLVKAGEITYTAFDLNRDPAGFMRWGDYSGMTIDPDGVTFWYLGEYSKNVSNTGAKWGNYIASTSFSGCTAAPLAYKFYLPILLTSP